MALDRRISKFLKAHDARSRRIDAINEFLNMQGPSYQGVLKKVKHVLEMFAGTPEGHRLIYKVTSRRDYQLENELKEAKSILGTMQKDGISSFSKVKDIVGIRVIYLYPSDVDELVSFIRKIRDIRVDQAKWKCDERTGYKGYHLKVFLNTSEPALRDVPCEVQLRSLLEEAWSVKTHGLIYKGTEASPEHAKHAKLLAEALRGIDTQSEIIKDQIELTRRTQGAFRTACLHFAAQHGAVVARSEKEGSKRAALQRILSLIKKREKSLQSGDVDSVLNQFKSYEQEHGVDLALCCQVLYLATLREKHDCDNKVFDFVGRWAETKPKPSPIRVALFKGTAQLYFGNLDASVNMFVQAFEDSRHSRDSRLEARSSSDLAYSLAERRNPDDRIAAYALIHMARSKFPIEPEFLDNEGFIKIAFSESASGILEGRTLCEKALLQFEKRGQGWRRTVFKYYECVAFSRLSALSKVPSRGNR